MMDFVRNWSFWVVGKGDKIQIWRDNWIPGKQTPPTFVGTQEETGSYEKVSDLIDAHSITWKVDVVRKLFNNADAEKILQIRLFATGDDRLVWTLTRNGQFTVRSAYNKLVDIKTNLQANYDEEAAKLYKKIWDIDTLPRVKNFI